MLDTQLLSACLEVGHLVAYTATSGMPAGASASTKENENMAMEVGNTFSTSLYTLTVISAIVIRINVSDNIAADEMRLPVENLNTDGSKS